MLIHWSVPVRPYRVFLYRLIDWCVWRINITSLGHEIGLGKSIFKALYLLVFTEVGAKSLRTLLKALHQRYVN